jgi:hypothetical protein
MFVTQLHNTWHKIGVEISTKKSLLPSLREQTRHASRLPANSLFHAPPRTSLCPALPITSLDSLGMVYQAAVTVKSQKNIGLSGHFLLWQEQGSLTVREIWSENI